MDGRKHMNISDVKQNNCNNIYQYLYKNRAATKREIAFELELSLPTVTNTLTDLMSLGLVANDTKVISKTGGRNPVAYSFIPDARVAIGLDISRHYIKSIVVDLDGNSVQYITRKIDYSRTDDYLKILGEEVENIIRETNLDAQRILGVGIAVPGWVEHEQGYVVDGRVIDNTGMTCADFSKYIQYKTKLIHDSVAAGVAEFTKHPELRTACYVNACNSFGGSVLVNDRIYLGDGLYSCEIGHLNLVPQGKKCYCGQLGCFDSYCSTEVLSCHTQGDLTLFFQKLEEGDLEITQIWDTYLDNMARAMTEIRMMFGCRIIIGGDIGAEIDKYMGKLREKVDALSPFGEKSEPYLVSSYNNKKAIAAGAAMFFVREFLGSDLYGNNTISQAAV